MEKAESKSGPLANVRVLDLGTMIAGPMAGTLMSDFGAEVIKIEQPNIGDTLRGVGPFAQGESLWFAVDGRNKKSITLDLRHPEGKRLLCELVAKSDVVIENFRPGTLSKWKLGYDTLSAVNPSIIMLSVSGFGQNGPYAGRAGYDRIGLAFSGVMGLTGYPDRPPVRVGTSIADYSTALMGAYAVMMALYHRDARGGTGQQIDLALYESMFRFSDSLVSAYDQLGLVRQRNGNVHFGAVPGDTFETKDGRYMIVSISSDAMFERMCRAMKRLDLLEEPKYATHALRYESVEELNRIAGGWIKATPVDVVCAALEENGIPFSIVLTIDDMVNDPQYAARQNIATIEHPKLGPLRMPGVVPKLSATPGEIRSAAPTIGEHNDEIYGTLLRLDGKEMQRLAAEGVI
jgi:crotonobetainyl-CoA:carnitine CoA-transferase CaiB-like acyl-CoA transferase